MNTQPLSRRESRYSGWGEFDNAERRWGNCADMSLVVGVTCEDGVVIACDCASTARVNGFLTRQKFYTDKFKLDSRNGWACAWVGARASIIAASKVGRHLRCISTSRRLSSCELIEDLQSAGDEAFAERQREAPGSFETACCLVAYDHGDAGPLSKVELYELTISATSTCTRIKAGSPKYVGDYVNPAAFFGWSLYSDPLNQSASVDESAFLAGFTIAAAHSFNPLSVDGLSVLLCKPGRFMALDDALVEEIKKQSHEIGNAIWENIRQHCVSFKDKMSNAISEPHFL